MLLENSSSEKVAATEGSVFWKSDHPKNVLSRKSRKNGIIFFWKNQLFRRYGSSEKADAVQKYLFRQGNFHSK